MRRASGRGAAASGVCRRKADPRGRDPLPRIPALRKGDVRLAERLPWLALQALTVGLALHNVVMALLWQAGVRGGALDVVAAWTACGTDASYAVRSSATAEDQLGPWLSL